MALPAWAACRKGFWVTERESGAPERRDPEIEGLLLVWIRLINPPIRQRGQASWDKADVPQAEERGTQEKVCVRWPREPHPGEQSVKRLRGPWTPPRSSRGWLVSP